MVVNAAGTKDHEKHDQIRNPRGRTVNTPKAANSIREPMDGLDGSPQSFLASMPLTNLVGIQLHSLPD